MSTPELKLTPNYITKGINKSLLTPCRRVGLSRKKKLALEDSSCAPLTPTGAVKRSLDDDECVQHKKPLLEGSPAAPMTPIVSVKRGLDDGECAQKNTKKVIEKVEESITDIKEALEEDAASAPCCVLKPHDPASPSDGTKSLSEPALLPPTTLKEEAVSSRHFTKPGSLDTGNGKETTTNTELARFSTEEYLQEYEKDPMAFHKTFHRSDSMRSESGKDYVAIIYPSAIKRPPAKKLFVSLENITQKQTASVSVSEDEDDMFTSSPDHERKQREKLVKSVIELEKTVKKKEETLECLKRAKIYQTKHSPAKLKIYSNRWMKGCRKGLTDLLQKLQEHAPMTMETLAQNLNIPTEIFNNLNL